MIQNKRAMRIGIFLAILAILVVVVAISHEPRIARRRQILAWKLSGSIPYVSWWETYNALRPSRFRAKEPLAGVTAKAVGHGAEPCPILWSTPFGSFWGQPGDDATLADFPHLYRYQRDAVSIQRGDVVVDIGSHIGTFTRIALQQGAARVIAIEPDPGSNFCFKKNFEKEIRDGRVVLLEAALWDSAGTIQFTVAARSDQGAVAPEFDPQWNVVRTVDVPTTTFDDAIAKLNPPQIDFIKWAIGDGTLKRALRGSPRTLSRFHPKMVMWIDADPVGIPPIVRQIVPAYHIFTHELVLAYFY